MTTWIALLALAARALAEPAASAAPAPSVPASAGSVEPPDVADLLERASKGVAMIPGCFNLEGSADDKFDAGLFGKGERVVAMGGQLQDGLWGPDYWVEWRSGPKLGEKETRGSMFGRFKHGDEETGDDAGRVSLEAMLEDEVAMDYVVPEGGGWKLVHSLRGGEAARNELTVQFDAALRPWRWTISIVDPIVIKGNRGRGRIEAMQLELQAAGDGAPAFERMVGEFKSWPFDVHVDSTARWTHKACPNLGVP